MTAVTARAAGVRDVWVASPRPSDVTLAAACVAGADGVLGIGGAQIVAALAYGAGPIEASDVIVGPGNRYVTAAKYVVSRDVGIDMLAGPSELVVVADEGDDAGCIAADLIAQAEHDPDARTRLVTTSEDLADRVDAALQAQLADLPTADVARASLAAGAAVVCANAEEMVAVVDRLAPEHLEVLTADPAGLAARFRHYGAVFVGRGAAEVFGDYGVGPNHTLPTGGTARHRGGLSVLDFLRVRTWMQDAGAGPSPELVADTRDLAELEGLIGHARSATQRF